MNGLLLRVVALIHSQQNYCSTKLHVHNTIFKFVGNGLVALIFNKTSTYWGTKLHNTISGKWLSGFDSQQNRYKTI